VERLTLGSLNQFCFNHFCQHFKQEVLSQFVSGFSGGCQDFSHVSYWDSQLIGATQWNLKLHDDKQQQRRAVKAEAGALHPRRSRWTCSAISVCIVGRVTSGSLNQFCLNQFCQHFKQEVLSQFVSGISGGCQNFSHVSYWDSQLLGATKWNLKLHDDRGTISYVELQLLGTSAAWFILKGEWMMKRERDGEAETPGPTQLILADLVPDENLRGDLHCMSGLFPRWEMALQVDESEFSWNRQFPFEAFHLRTSPQLVAGSANTTTGVSIPTKLGPSVHAATEEEGKTTKLGQKVHAATEEEGKKKRRKRRDEGANIISFNANCWATVKDFLTRTDAQVVMGQETKLDGDRIKEAEEWCIRNGWKAFFSPCLRSDKGEPRGGAAVFVRKHISACAISGPKPGSTPASVLDGWCAAAHVDYGCRGGLVLGSVYLECNIGLKTTSSNWQRLSRIGEMLTCYGRPFVLGGDWNASVHELNETGWPASVQGRIAAIPSSDLGTCRSPEGNWSTIDYFVVSRQVHISHQYVAIVGGEPPRPHLPTRIRLSVTPRAHRERTLKRVKQFPFYRPIGPQPKPPDWDTSGVTEGLQGQAKVDALYPFVIGKVEEELLNCYGIEEEVREGFRGRGKKPAFVWRQAGGAPNASHPASNARGRKARLLEKRLLDAISAWKRGNFLIVAQSLLLGDTELFDLWGTCYAGYWMNLMGAGCGTQALEEITAISAWCNVTADSEEKEASRVRAESFRSWNKAACAAGGGAAHAFAKAPKGWQAALVPGGPHPGAGLGTTGEVQAVVDAELTKWSAIWKVFGPDKPEDLPPWPVMQRVVPIFEEEVRQACSSYNWRAGVSVHQIHPRHLSMLSDQCLFAIAYMLYCMELLGNWPDQMSIYSFFLLPKPGGDFRTIGLLPDVYRIWAKIRMPLVRDWGAKVPRQFFAAGPGRSTEDAVGRVLLASEQMDYTHEAACFILDIDKCYENVDHGRLQRAAVQHDFPLSVARACIAMYRCWRTVAWDGVYGKLVRSAQTLVAGCSIALWLLQLLMLTPLDEFVQNLPIQVRMPEVFVDDATVVIVGKVGTVAKIATQAAKDLARAFEQGCSLPVSATKGQVTGSTMALGREIAKRLVKLGCKAVRAMKVLGIDTAAGRGGLRATQNLRCTALGKKVRRLLRLRQAGPDFVNVVRSSAPMVTHGSRVIGMQPSVLDRMKRTLAVALPHRAKSASLSLRFLTAPTFRLEPSFAACEAPLLFWCKLAFDARGDRSVIFEMNRAWRRQAIRLGWSKRPWSLVAGPAGAVVLTLKRLGWVASTAFNWKTQDGVCLDIRDDAPKSIRKLIFEAVEKCLWREWAAKGDQCLRRGPEDFIREPGGYWMEELRK
jgi:hypothetical protein